jgi:tRNA-specific 2-thiouridylase
MNGRIAVAMSGGVDSSAAAALLVEQGHDVVGITLQLWDYSETNLAAGKGRCCSPADIADARTVAAQLEIPHYVFDHTAHFREQIVEPFLDEYTRGRTPSPCISCNRHVKFDLLWRMAEALGAETLATGHYARTEPGTDRPQIRQGLDVDKDQSYFLFDVPADLLANARFPLGDLDKEQVRQHANRLGLVVADKPESYELCFIPDGDKDAFIANERPDQAGAPVILADVDGATLAAAEGVHRFTVGQRRGLGVEAADKLYVLSVAGDSGTITVGSEDKLYSAGLTASECNWLAIAAPQKELRVQAQIRHRHAHADATIRPLGEGAYEVDFDVAQRAIAPGQGVAFYDDGLLLGGGWIAAARS